MERRLERTHAGSRCCAVRERRSRSGLGFSLAQPGDPITGLPLAALAEQFHSLEAFEDISFCARGAGGAKAAMLRHDQGSVKKALLSPFLKPRRVRPGIVPDPGTSCRPAFKRAAFVTQERSGAKCFLRLFLSVATEDFR
jgi:hypothetical protein